MPRFRILLCLLLFVFAGVAFLVVHAESKRRTPFWDKYQKVQLGMTEEEVKAILGPPDSVEGGGLMSSCWAWFVGEQTIAVDFNLDDRATEKRLRPGRTTGWVRDPAPSLVERVLDWLWGLWP